MHKALPIVENNNGELEFLYGSNQPGDNPRIASRGEPFPDTDNLRRVLETRRGQRDPWERYAHARVANNLAAVYACLGLGQDAYDATMEAEAVLQEMLKSSNPYPPTLTLVGLCVAHYHASLLYMRLGEEGLTESQQHHEYALSLLDGNDHLYRLPPGMNQAFAPSRTQIDFVRSALIAVGKAPSS